MPDSSEERLKVGGQKDVATLTRAVENVFRKLIRFLVGRISLVKLQEMINYIYVEECEIDLRNEAGGKSVPLTKLAIVTGLDTRTLTTIRQKIESSGSMFQQHFLRDLTPESAVVDVWADRVAKAAEHAKEGQRALTYGDEDSEFEKLFRSVITSRGITTQSIIDRLITTKSAVLDKDERRIRLVVTKFSPYLSDDEANSVNAALSAVSNLISTIDHNVGLPQNDKFFQRQVWTFRLRPEKRNEFRICIRKFLEEAEQRAICVMAPWESENYEDRFLGTGLGLYYFEEMEDFGL